MSRVIPFTVVCELPEELSALGKLSRNLWWTWNTQEIFERLGGPGFDQIRRNPVQLLNSLSQDGIKKILEDKQLLAEIRAAEDRLVQYRALPRWEGDLGTVAYFSAEFGLHESLQIYSGGLGVLAGDTLKGASDLGVPLVGIGLLYYEGYFHQYLNVDGWQQETYPPLETINLPLEPVLRPDGSRAEITVQMASVATKVRAWRVDVGSTSLLLLDTNYEANEPWLRETTARLYGGDVHTRIRQELVLGIGGLKILREIGIQPTLCHLNEGHSAFLSLERFCFLTKERHLSFDEALLNARASHLFTTHTPVPAGNDVFHRDILAPYLEPYANEIGVDLERLLALGRVNETDSNEPFSMTVFALRTSGAANGVSELHGKVSRRIWQSIWPRLPVDEIPIGSVTNGVHTATWVSGEMAELYTKHLGSDWARRSNDQKLWERVSTIPDDELWRVRAKRRAALVSYCRAKLAAQLVRRSASKVEIERASTTLDPHVLTIGFARRFAAYKRASLVLRDITRLSRMIGDPNRPVQFVFAGKAHPADHAGKQLIAEIIHVARNFPRRFVFLEDYDAGIARVILQGVDVWLNNPRRPLEASGTSGMKAAVNGALNLSVLDGWWCEAFDPQNGWCIGSGEEYPDPAQQDEIESRNVYDLLEHEVIPLFYESETPAGWIQMMRNSISQIAGRFSTQRMVADYAERYYAPLSRNARLMAENGFHHTRVRAEKLKYIREGWAKVRILSVESTEHVGLGNSLPIRVLVRTGGFSPEDLAVEVTVGKLSSTGKVPHGEALRLTRVEGTEDPQVVRYSGDLPTTLAGSFGFSARVVPSIDGGALRSEPGLIHWWE